MLNTRSALLLRGAKGVGMIGVLTALCGATVDVEAWNALKVCQVATASCPYTSVQEAVEAARSGDTIEIGPGVFTGSIFLGNMKDLKIVGRETTRTILRGGTLPTLPPNTYVDALICRGGGTILIRGVTITHTTGGNGGGISNSDCIMTIENSTVKDNLALSLGGGIFNAGTMMLKSSDIQNNLADLGGGIYNEGTLTIKDSNILNNKAGQSPSVIEGGGGINNKGTLTLQNSDVTGNESIKGGGIVNHGGTVVVKSSAIHHNHALLGDGGGIWNSGTVRRQSNRYQHS